LIQRILKRLGENLNNLSAEIAADVEAVRKIPIVTTLLEVVCRTTGMGFAAVARVTEDKWVACEVRDEISFGLKPGGELELKTTICHEIRQHGKEVIIDHVEMDPLFCNHHTPRQYGFQSYISIPIILKDGGFFGTLCAIDPRPAKLNNPATIGMFKLFAELISFHLQSMDKLHVTESSLSEERKTSELREQFIAILGHDLRNPLSAVANSATVLLQMPLEEDALQLAGIIKSSSARMAGLIDNTLDFARGHLGGGITLDLKPCESLEKTLHELIAELQALFPERKIITTVELAESVHCDSTRISQLFSNLLGNALKYGNPGTPVKVVARSGNGQFELSVTNYCHKISEDVLHRIFQPFCRGEVRQGREGLGLGLYIASEIARAHGGQLSVRSTEGETIFTLRMPSKVKG
jgi:K+-sensing histidine kinase KdpD